MTDNEGFYFQSVMCRLCGCTGNVTYWLLKESLHLVNAIEEETKVKIRDSDCFPKTVCKICIDKIYMIKHFREHSVKTQKVLELMHHELKLNKIQIDNRCKIQNVEQNEEKDSMSEEWLDEEFDEFKGIEESASESGAKIIELREPEAGKEEQIVKHQPTSSEKETKIDRSGRKYQSTSHRYIWRKSPTENQCIICRITFRFPFQTAEHIRKEHTGECPFACNKCNKSFVTGYKLMRHQRTHLESQHICNICNKSFREKYLLKDHQKIHINSKPTINCSDCSKSFYTKSMYDAHKMQHKARNFICEECGRGFQSNSLLERHKLIHGSRNYQCPKCPWKVKSKMQLKEHLKNHNKLGQFKCDVCMLSFRTTKGLAIHSRIHGSLIQLSDF